MKSIALSVLLAFLGCSHLAVAQTGVDTRLPKFGKESVPLEEWPTEVVERLAAAPDSYSGDLPISELVDQVLSDFSDGESTVSITFDIPVIQDDQVLIDSSVMGTLPMEQAQADVDSYGFTEGEMRSSRIDAFVSVPFSMAEYQEGSGSGSEPFSTHVEQSLERYFVAGYSQSSPKKGGNPSLQYNPSSPNCGGAAVGTSFTLSVTNCLGTLRNTYQCQQHTVNGETRNMWINTSSDFIPRDVDEICW